MIIERAEVSVKPGLEEEFEIVMAGRAGDILRGADGCASLVVGRGVENPDMFILLLEWDSVESHIALTKTPEFGEFKALVGHLFAGSPRMEHFAIVRA